MLSGEGALPAFHLARAAIQMLAKVPSTWALVPEMSHLEEPGCGVPVAAGLVEWKLAVRIRAVGDERVVAVHFGFTGQNGLAEAVETRAAEARNLWERTWKERKHLYMEPPRESGDTPPYRP